jgi:hypothetical protein
VALPCNQRPSYWHVPWLRALILLSIVVAAVGT